MSSECHTKDHSPPLESTGLVINIEPQNIDPQIDDEKRDQLGSDTPFLH